MAAGCALARATDLVVAASKLELQANERVDPMPRKGVIGEQIYTEVEQLVSGGLNRTQAFAQISKQSGRKTGTVAANYYRIARQRADESLRTAKQKTQARAQATKTPSTRRSPSARARRSVANGGEITALTSDLIRSIDALATAIKAQDGELQELRSRLDGVKTLLG